ncbi:MAG: CPBP family intramembrane metalloprotease [Calditrichaeota bacterium]|nr:CPBP family intramembrane metalloprotease [Calditrichota bacterium]
MSQSPIQTVFVKELRDLYRDRRTLMVTVVLPLLMYPLLFIGIMQITLLQAGKLKQQAGVIALLTPVELPGGVFETDSSSLLEFADSTGWRERLRAGELDAALALSPGFSDSLQTGGTANVQVYYLSSRDFSDQIMRRIRGTISDYQSGIVEERLAQFGLDTSFVEPIAFEAVDEATEQEQAGSELGRFLGYFLILTTLSGAFYAAIDLTAGEKERGTLETLLVSPASRRELVYGKFLATMTAALITALLNLLSMGFTTMYGIKSMGEAAGLSFSVSIGALLLVLAVLIPMAVLFAGVSLAVSVTARNYKEGQGLLTPLIFISILPAMVSMVPGIELTPLLAVVPIANISLLMRALLSGQTPLLELFITLASTAGLALLSLHWVTVQFNRESVLFRHAEDVKWSPFRKPVQVSGKRLAPGAVGLLAALAIILVGSMGTIASPENPLSGVYIVQFALAALAGLWVYQGGYDPVAAFGWKPPGARNLLAALLAVCGGWVLTIELATLQHMFFPFPEDLLKQFTDLFGELESLPTWQAIAIIALIPAVVEEHLCRGLMLRGLERETGKWSAILLVAAVFAILHLNPYRLLPTFALGVLLGYLAVRTGSIYPAILGHFVNNAFSALVFRYEEWFVSHGWAAGDEAAWVPASWLLGGLLFLGVGLALLRSSPTSVESNAPSVT